MVTEDLRFTFAVVGRDEEATVGRVLAMAFAAARPDADEVWFVDSASVDGSAALAASLGAEVLSAPAGKGRAIAAALERCRTDRLVLVDADVVEADGNLALGLRRAAEASPWADMVVGQAASPSRPSSSSPFLYRPLAAALFPEAPAMRKPLSGFRVLDPARDYGRLPPGFGVEVHLNLHVAATGGRIELCDLGAQRGTVRGPAHRARMAAEIAEAVLDLAQGMGRISAGARPQWDAWAAGVLAALRDRPAPGAPDGYFARLRAAASRPLPPR